MNKGNEIYELLIENMAKYLGTLFGITDISYSEYRDKYQCAIVFAVPHNEILSLKNYTEENFQKNTSTARARNDVIVSDISYLLREHNIEYYVPPVAQTSEETLIAPFSFKFAAVNSGIGWIGKNGVLITNEYGPRVSLSAILINCDLHKGIPITQSKCNDGCNLCVKACPYKALKGKQWNINILREELIDYQLCNRKRRLFMKTHKRKNACGLCMVACPLGL